MIQWLITLNRVNWEWQAAHGTAVQNGYETEPRGGAEYACAKERALVMANSGDSSLGVSCKNCKLEVVAVSEVQAILPPTRSP